MNKINDDMLNKYLDNELNENERNQLKIMINDSSEAGKNYESLKQIHNILKSSELETPSQAFTGLLIKKINSQKLRSKKQKYFLFSILSILGVIILGIVVFVFVQVLSSTGNATDQVVNEYSYDVGNYFTKIFGKQNISIFGSILSFVMLLSAYFIYEFQKRSKNHFSH